jgi:hypothetical protein
VVKRVPHSSLGIAVGSLVLILVIYQTMRLIG